MPTSALTEGLSAGLPVEEIALHADGAALADLELPETLAGGSGVILTTVLDRRPRRLTLHARRASAAITTHASSLPTGADRFALAKLPQLLTDDSDEEPAVGTAAMAHARRLGVLGTGGAMLVIDRRTTSGAARHDLARRTGAITFTPAPETLERETLSMPPQVAATMRLRRAGELPKSSVQMALRDQLLPRVRICYRDALRSSPTLAGQLIIELEIARAEVMSVNLEGDHFPEALVGCVADAAFAMTTPSYELGGLPDTVFVVRKPIQLQAPASADAEPTVSLDDVFYPATNPAGRPALEVEADAPL